MPVRWEMLREREREPRCRNIQSQAERGQTEKSWLLFEGIDTLLYDLMRKSKIYVTLFDIVNNDTTFVCRRLKSKVER